MDDSPTLVKLPDGRLRIRLDGEEDLDASPTGWERLFADAVFQARVRRMIHESRAVAPTIKDADAP